MLSTITIKKPSIIVVDDEYDLVELFSEILRSNGYDVHAFTDPISAAFNMLKILLRSTLY